MGREGREQEAARALQAKVVRPPSVTLVEKVMTLTAAVVMMFLTSRCIYYSAYLIPLSACLDKGKVSHRTGFDMIGRMRDHRGKPKCQAGRSK